MSTQQLDTGAAAEPEVKALRQYDHDCAMKLKDILFNDKHEKRAKWEKLFEDPVFRPKFNLTLDEQRDLAYARLKKVHDSKLFSIFDFENDKKNVFTAHEMLGMIDGSLATKFTVQNNLFGGTLMALYTDRHLEFMKQVDSLYNMGCFCFTELGFGNNAPEMETTAIYDNETKQFTINCPTVMSQKYWITNGACHATHAIVFARTIVNGKNEGVNSFIVPCRDNKTLKALPGVFIEDMGIKMGLNGIDNGRLIFTNVKIPRENMLNRFNDVNEQGVFKADRKKPSQRFFQVADRLLSGRLCISAMCISAAQATLYTTVRYSQQRLAVGESGQSDTPIMSYQLQMNALIPLIVRTVCLKMGHNAGKDLFADPTGREHEQIRTFCAIKAMNGWHLMKVGSVCRERCGGGSYLAYNRIDDAIWSAHSGCTAEGDNRVLMQKVVKDIMQDMQKETHRMPQMTKCPKRQLPVQDSITDIESLTNLIFYREQAEIKSMIKTVQKKLMEEGQSFFDVWMFQLSDEIQNLAIAFGERFILENSIATLNQTPAGEPKVLLAKIIKLHSMSLVRDNLSWYLSNGVISAKAAKDLEVSHVQAIKDFLPNINDTIEAFGVPKIEQLSAPIARDYVKFNSQSDMENTDAAGPLFDFTQTGRPRPRL